MKDFRVKVVYLPTKEVRELSNINWVTKQVTFSKQIEIREEKEWGMKMDVITTVPFDQVRILQLVGLKEDNKNIKL